MKKTLQNHASTSATILAAFVLVGCGSPVARDFGGAWHAVNRFQNFPTEIPLNREYVFFAAPMDGTLKAMLERWSKDSGMTLSYQLQSDFTLFAPVSAIHTSSLRAAAEQLSSIYVMQGVAVSVKNRQILVRPASPTAPVSAADGGTVDAGQLAAESNGK